MHLTHALDTYQHTQKKHTAPAPYTNTHTHTLTNTWHRPNWYKLHHSISIDAHMHIRDTGQRTCIQHRTQTHHNICSQCYVHTWYWVIQTINDIHSSYWHTPMTPTRPTTCVNTLQTGTHITHWPIRQHNTPHTNTACQHISIWHMAQTTNTLYI